jgi:DHA1 family inner membrane transport protein
MPIAIYALSLAAFAIGTAEFVISGILPDLAADFAVSIPTAGLLVTAYAAAVAIGGPILAVLTARLPRKPMIVALLIVFVFGQALCALAPSYGWLMAARVFVAASHGLFYGIASVAAADLVPANKRGTALALFLGGITVANVLGVPAGTAIGNAFGWRWAFWAVGACGLIATIGVAWLLPQGHARHAEGVSVRAELRALAHQQVYLSYAVIFFIMVGALAFATYQVPVLMGVTGVPQALTPAYLVTSGIGTIIGIYCGGRLADWRLMPSLIGIILIQVLLAGVMLFAMHQAIAMAVSMFLSGALGFAFNSPVQSRILNAASAAPNLAATLVSSAFNIGIGLGAYVGALWIDHGLGYQTLPVVGIVSSLIAAGIATYSWRLDRRGQALNSAVSIT